MHSCIPARGPWPRRRSQVKGSSGSPVQQRRAAGQDGGHAGSARRSAASALQAPPETSRQGQARPAPSVGRLEFGVRVSTCGLWPVGGVPPTAPTLPWRNARSCADRAEDQRHSTQPRRRSGQWPVGSGQWSLRGRTDAQRPQRAGSAGQSGAEPGGRQCRLSGEDWAVFTGRGA